VGLSNTRNILCIDDDPQTLKLRRLLLESARYGVLTAVSAEEALGLLSEDQRIDLILLDFLMPDGRGDEFARAVKREKPTIPIVVVSAVSASKLPNEFMQSVNGYVQKGQPPEVLLDTIAQVLQATGKC